MPAVGMISDSALTTFDDVMANRYENISNNGSGSNESSIVKKEEKWMWVLDPLTRKLRVPLHLLAPTEATATTGTVPSLCIAYLEGRCRHAWCRQAHVLPSAIRQLRFEALNAPTCCYFHNDPHDISKLTDRFKFIRIVNNGSGGNTEPIPSERVASTVGLLRYLVHNVPSNKTNRKNGISDSKEKEAILNIPAKSVCRLHLAHRCRYLEDCNNIHVCRESEAHLQLSPHVLTTLTSINSSTRTAVLTETCYTVSMLTSGEVSDAEFNALYETQKKQHNSPCHMSSWSVTDMGLIGPAKSTSANLTAKSPLSCPVVSTPSPLSECWQSISLASGLVTNNTPSFLTPPVPPHVIAAPQIFNSSHVRVYDVRPKDTASKNSSNDDTNTSVSNNAHNESFATENLALDASFIKQNFYTTPHHGNVCNGSSVKMNSITFQHFSSTEGGVSISSSAVNTPTKEERYENSFLSASAAGVVTKRGKKGQCIEK